MLRPIWWIISQTQKIENLKNKFLPFLSVWILVLENSHFQEELYLWWLDSYLSHYFFRGFTFHTFLHQLLLFELFHFIRDILAMAYWYLSEVFHFFSYPTQKKNELEHIFLLDFLILKLLFLLLLCSWHHSCILYLCHRFLPNLLRMSN